MVHIKIRTNDTNLDRLLAADDWRKNPGVIYRDDDSGALFKEAPVILILGAAGSGKTALALQLCDATSIENAECAIFLYNLEQSKSSLLSAAKHFGLKQFNTNSIRDFQDYASSNSCEAGKIYLCHLAPLPLSDRDDKLTFEDRFQQICHLIAVVRGESSSVRKALVFIIDSLNALSTTPLERSDIYRLFSVFRSQGIPLVITAERQELGASVVTSVSESARFLADVVIELKKDISRGHMLQYLEISKSRIQRQALGNHLYKIRTKKGGSRGVHVYRSIPCVISEVRAELSKHKNEKYCVYSETKEKDLGLLFPVQTVRSGHCFALLGPPGTHKFAVALNLAAGKRKRSSKTVQRILILSFGGFLATDLSRTAWFEENENWRKIGQLAGTPKEKWWLAQGGTDKLQAEQWTFRIGHLTPEECFDHIDIVTACAEKFSAVVLSDTAMISTGFPLLKADQLFIPALIDLFRSRGLCSIGIGVQSENGQNREMDFALQSCADTRLYFSHYPSVYDLSKYLMDHEKDNGKEVKPHTEQQVGVIADVVADRIYNRQPHWLNVTDDKVLQCKKNMGGPAAGA